MQTPSTYSYICWVVHNIALYFDLGALFGGISSIETACFIVGNLIFNPIYSHTVTIFRGSVYLVMAGNVLVSLILLL